MAVFHPPFQPDFLGKTHRDAERSVWDVFQKLDDTWHVFYSARESSSSGFNREVDFILIWYNRIFYIEVKGGIVEVNQPAGPGVCWPPTTRGGASLKPVDPTQLWDAKKALRNAISQIAGKSPADLGYLEHEFYVFPHTSRAVLQGRSVERKKVHYVFAEDIAQFPARLFEIIQSERGIFVQPEWIDAIIQSLDSMVVKSGRHWLHQDQPQALTALKSIAFDASHCARQPANDVPPLAAPAIPLSAAPQPIGVDRAAGWLRIGKLFCIWRGLAAIAILLAVAITVFLPERGKAPPQADPNPAAQADQPRSEPQGAPRISAGPKAGRNRAASGQSKPREPGYFPAFIPAGAIAAVELALSHAREYDRSVPWHSGDMHGFATLQAVEPMGCRRYRITRNDTDPIGLDFIRRCP
jgi:hypothetical protein